MQKYEHDHIAGNSTRNKTQISTITTYITLCITWCNPFCEKLRLELRRPTSCNTFLKIFSWYIIILPETFTNFCITQCWWWWRWLFLTLLTARRMGFRGRGRKRWEIREGKAKQELRRLTRTLPQAFFGQGCYMRGTGDNMNGGMGFYSTGRAEGTRD